MRYYGLIPGSLPRISTKDHFFDGVAISKGTSVSVQPVSTHYSEIFYVNPFEFRPERWLE